MYSSALSDGHSDVLNFILPVFLYLLISISPIIFIVCKLVSKYAHKLVTCWHFDSQFPDESDTETISTHVGSVHSFENDLWISSCSSHILLVRFATELCKYLVILEINSLLFNLLFLSFRCEVSSEKLHFPLWFLLIEIWSQWTIDWNLREHNYFLFWVVVLRYLVTEIKN